MTTEKEFYTAREMAELTGRLATTIAGWCKQGKMPGARMSGDFGRHVWLIPKATAEDPRWVHRDRRKDPIEWDNEPDFLTVREAALLLNRKPATVSRFCVKGRFPGAKKMETGRRAYRAWAIPKRVIQDLCDASDRGEKGLDWRHDAMRPSDGAVVLQLALPVGRVNELLKLIVKPAMPAESLSEVRIFVER